MMRVFSSRRESITADLRTRAARFEQRYGRAPSQRELAHLAQASNFTTRAAKHGTLDAEQLHAGWADKLTRTLGVSLASVAPSVWHGHTNAHARNPGAPDLVSTELELVRAAQNAVALAQRDKSTWTRADVIKYLGRVLPRTGREPAAAAALLEDLADRAKREGIAMAHEASSSGHSPPSSARSSGFGGTWSSPRTRRPAAFGKLGRVFMPDEAEQQEPIPALAVRRTTRVGYQSARRLDDRSRALVSVAITAALGTRKPRGSAQ
jgi:hypothetical protein